MLMKEIKEDTTDGQMLLDWKNQYYQNDYTNKDSLQIQCNFYQVTNGIFHRIRTKKKSLYGDTKDSKHQSNLEKENLSWNNQVPCLQTMLKSYSHQDTRVLAQKIQICGIGYKAPK